MNPHRHPGTKPRPRNTSKPWRALKPRIAFSLMAQTPRIASFCPPIRLYGMAAKSWASRATRKKLVRCCNRFKAHNIRFIPACACAVSEISKRLKARCPRMSTHAGTTSQRCASYQSRMNGSRVMSRRASRWTRRARMLRRGAEPRSLNALKATFGMSSACRLRLCACSWKL